MGKHSGDQGGRPKSVKKLVSEALDLVDQSLPSLFETLIGKANNGDREALIYLIDRRLGKPKAVTEVIDETGLSRERFLLVQIAIAEAKRMITQGVVVEGEVIKEIPQDIGGEYAIQRPEEESGSTEGLPGKDNAEG